jgi:hypothetical protein
MRRSLPLVLAVVALAGCRNEYSTFTPALKLVVTVSDPNPTAGDEVEYLAYMDGASEPVLVEDVLLSSTAEPLLDWDDDSLTPTLAGKHTLVATAVFKGSPQIATVEMQVDPGAPATVDLELTDYQAKAGETIAWGVRAWDAYGNETDTTTVSVETNSEYAVLQGADIYSTVPDLYTATATAAEGPFDVEDFIFTASDPATLVLELSDTDLEKEETTIATVLIHDDYGNLVDMPFDLWVDPGTYVDVEYNAITFHDEGEFTVWAATPDQALSDSVGPLLIDSTGPDLVVENPPRGTQTIDLGQFVSGTVADEWTGVTSVVVNGDNAAISGNGWSVWQDYDFGTTFLDTEALDGDGNVTTDLRGVLSGTYTPYGNGIGDGIEARITEDGFDAIEDLASGFLDLNTLAASIPNPVVNQKSQTCTWFGCITWYSLQISLSNMSFGATTLDIDPTSGGYLDTEAQINNPYIYFTASGKVIGISYSQSGSISASWIKLNMDMYPWVSNNVLGVDVYNADTTTAGFDFDLEGWLWDVLDFFGISFDSLIEGFLTDAISDMAQDEIPDLVADAVQGLEIGMSFPIEDNIYDMDALPYSVDVNDKGMTLGLETWFTADTWESPFYSDPGSLTYPYTPPTYGNASNDMVLGISEDFVNQALHALWGGGLLEMELAGDDLGLDLGDLGAFLPSLTDPTFGVSAYLPPVVLPGTGDSLLDLQLGDLELSIYNGDAIESNLWMRFYVQVQAGLELGASGNLMTAGLGDVEIEFDLTYPNERSVHAGSAESLLSELVGLILPSLTDALGEIEIPDLAGFTLSNVTVDLDGSEDGYVTLGGDLSSTN